jgi:hypothetical protein
MNASSMGTPGYNAIGLVFRVSINALASGTRNMRAVNLYVRMQGS